MLFCKNKTTNIITVSNSEISELLEKTTTVVITGSSCLKLYPNIFPQNSNKIIVVNNTVKAKSIENFTAIIEKLIELKANKNTHLIGVGGGEITDLTGFIASIYMRGITVSFIPTTLLAMVDASVGGKNALDFGNIKNIIGTIYQPKNVFLNFDFLNSLPQEQILSGFAEILKIGFLFDENLLQNSMENFNQNEPTKLFSIIQKCIDYKLKIVAEDEFDLGKRKLLNFGHTVGHILELEYNLSHGEAVAYGMIFETKLATMLGFTTVEVFDTVNKIISKYFTKSLKNFDLKNFIDKVIFDKKNIASKIALTVIKEIGFSELVEVSV